jgi:hypothetical protein
LPSVRFRRTAPHQTGDAPATGYFRFKLTRPVIIPGDPDDVVTTVPFKAVMVGGAVDVELAPTGAGYAWQVLESVDGVRDETYFVVVPNVPGPLDDADLTRVDPGTLSPRAAPVAAWWAVADATITGAEIVGDDLILTRHDGGTVNAGTVRPSADELAAAVTAAAPPGAITLLTDTDGRPYFA